MHSYTDLPPLDGLSALLAAADSGSFTAAAEALSLTHGSVSRRIAGLEAWLGTVLFERHGRGVHLTPAGQRFAQQARQALAGLSQSSEHWRPWRGRQTVRLSVVPSFARLWLLPRLAQLERNDLHVELIAEHRPSDLGDRQADVAIRYGKGQWEGLAFQKLFSETLVPAAAPHVARDVGCHAGPQEIMAMPLIHDSDTAQWRLWLEEGGVRYRPRWQDRRFEDYDSVLAAAQAGLGIALLRIPLAVELVRQGHLVAISHASIVNPAGHFVCTQAEEKRAAVGVLVNRLLELPAEDVDP